MSHTNESTSSRKTEPPVAYLVLREGTEWSESYQLTPGQVTTIGRSTTNRIVLADDLCSRTHCEVFSSEGHWMIRDLDSRNGTFLDGVQINGDHQIEPEQLIEIGNSDLALVYDLKQEVTVFAQLGDLERDTDPAIHLVFEEEHEGQPEIISRRRESRFRKVDQDSSNESQNASRQVARLYRLAMEMAAQQNTQRLSEVVLKGLTSATSADIGAILLIPPELNNPTPADLRVIAFTSQVEQPYQKVSRYLSETTFETQEAILARDVADDSKLATRDSLGRIHANSVICAPIRQGDRFFGLVHLYSTNPDNSLDDDQLEYTLAVADQMATALVSLDEKESLAAGLEDARYEFETLKEQIARQGQIVGDSQQVELLREQIKRIAPTEATVLIRGESGVGKELVARGIHEHSNRQGKPFITMNCAALSETLLESELFGHERGSFTGAIGRKIGKFEQADGGTLFLDEVGEMGAAIQAKFLRVLEGHPFERVGGSERIDVDVRVVAATNRDLETAVNENTFRKDLYFRLHVVQINVPSLRERLEDIPLLANYFLARAASRTSQELKTLSDDAIRTLMKYHWPGNIRELQNTVERTVILTRGQEIQAEDIQLSALEMPKELLSVPEPVVTNPEQSLEEIEQQHILSVLEETGWNKSKSAQILGIERSTLDRKLKKYNVSRPEKKK
ncbi:MAG: sigma 54-interacting transcriptional regulator [Planctomycetaceae bacterium]|nr:sigma 54-interacting transcriptional regulator [Planctomycetaceae bacterium]